MRFDLAASLAPIVNAYQRLSNRERTLVSLAGAALVVIIVYTMIWQPIEDDRVQLARRIQTKKAELGEVQRMRDVYLELQNQYDLRERILEKADPRFSLFPHIESTVSQVLGGRDKIASMNPQNKDLSGMYREESVELKLNGVTLQQLVDLMFHIEKGSQPLRLTRLQLKKRPREPTTFDVTATVSMLKSLQNAPHAPEKPPQEPVGEQDLEQEQGTEQPSEAPPPAAPAPGNA